MVGLLFVVCRVLCVARCVFCFFLFEMVRLLFVLCFVSCVLIVDCYLWFVGCVFLRFDRCLSCAVCCCLCVC